MGSSELLNGLPGQHVPPPPPPRAMNGRMQPPPPPPSSQAGTFQARVQQKKVIASLLQRGPWSVLFPTSSLSSLILKSQILDPESSDHPLVSSYLPRLQVTGDTMKLCCLGVEMQYAIFSSLV